MGVDMTKKTNPSDWPLPRSFVRSCEKGAFSDAAEIQPPGSTRQPIQTQVLKRWSDRSIALCRVDTGIDPSASDGKTVELTSLGLDRILFHRGDHVFELQVVVTSRNRRVVGQPKGPVETSDSGPCRHRRHIKFVFAVADSATIEADVAIDLFTNTPFCEIELTIQNRTPMDHPGGNWDLGARGSINIDDFVLMFMPSQTSRETSFALRLRDRDQSFGARQQIQIDQVSSGGENWNSSNHVDRFGKVNWLQQGYRALVDDKVYEGLRAEPSLHADYGAQISLAPRKFWQNFPCSLRANSSSVEFSVLRGQELQGGEQKTFEIAIELGTTWEETNVAAFAECDRTKRVFDTVAESFYWPYLKPRSSQSDERYEALVNFAIEGKDSFFRKREAIDEYGWRNFGDVWGDHEAVYHRGRFAAYLPLQQSIRLHARLRDSVSKNG